MKKLMRCPFCGHKNILILSTKSMRIPMRAQCLLCKARTKQFHTEEEVIKAWNRRPQTISHDWVNAKERLPEKEGRYLIIEDHHYNWVGMSEFKDGKFNLSVNYWVRPPELPEDKK